MMSYQPIENYGIIGDMHTVALVGIHGSIDWLCFPRFDSPALFAALLDDHKGGRFAITPEAEKVDYKQYYWPDTNVLITRFLHEEGIGEIIDFMPVGEADRRHGFHQLVRRVRVLRGQMRFRMLCQPAFNFARTPHQTTLLPEGARFTTDELDVGLATTLPLNEEGGAVTATFTLQEEQSVSFLLSILANNHADVHSPGEAEIELLFTQTVEYWHGWLAQCTYTGRWREIVYRSALCLKLLTYAPTGAIIAAPTCSLPETIGGERNWDYRYTWIRDAAFTVYALIRIGFTQEAGNFMAWVEQRAREPNPDGSLQIMYSIHGEHHLAEETLDHLEGYHGSRPVRVGNGAARQLQLDIYGELFDSVYLYNKYGAPISYDFWTHLRRLADYVCDHWHLPDEGIWEVRGGRRQFVYSKLMCWVALDRAIRLADKRSFPADRLRWLATRDQIYEDIMDRGWNEELQSFVQAYDDDTLDASNLLMPLVFFMAPNDPRMLATLNAINRPRDEGGLVTNSLVYRYDVHKSPDGLKGEEGTFNICSFWLVEALTRAGRTDPARLAEARLDFERMLTHANHLGLYAEETGPRGEALGNFPQAFTHLSLISAAFNLDRALNKG
jgi:GH15 family glucan-1,4-alpha-glucosidase